MVLAVQTAPDESGRVLPALISIVDAGHRYAYANSAYADWFGIDPAQLVGKHVREVLGESAYAALQPRMQAALGGKTQSFEADVPYAAGTRRVHARYVPQRGRDGAVTGYVGFVQDGAGATLAGAGHAEDLEEFVDNANVGLHWVDRDGRIVWANGAELEMMGYEAQEYIGQRIHEFHCDPDTIAEFLRILAEGGRLQHREARLRRKDGSIIDVLVTSSARMEGGRLVHTRCFTFDNTARKKAEALAAAKLRQQEALIRLGAAAVSALSANALMDTFARGIADTLGHSHVALLRDDGDAFVLEAQHGFDGAPLRTRIPKQQTPQAEFTLRSQQAVTLVDVERESRFPVSPALRGLGIRGGITVPVGVRHRPWGVLGTHWRQDLEAADQDTAFLQTAADLLAGTLARLAREEELLQSVQESAARERQQRAAAALARAALTAQDLPELCRLAAESVAETLDHRFAAVLRWDRAKGVTELVGQTGWGESFLGSLTPVTPDSHIGYTIAKEQAITIPDLAAESRFRGHEALRSFQVTCGMSVPIHGEHGIWGVITTHATRHVPYTMEDPNFLHNVAGIVAGAIARFDRDEAARTATRKLQEAMARRSQFLNVVAHDLRTPLTPIRLRLELLRKRLGDGAGPDIDILDRNLDQLGSLVTKLLDVARASEGRIPLERRPTPLHALVQDVAATFDTQARASGVTLWCDLAPVTAHVDADRIQQAVANLVANAIKFSPAGGRVRIACRTEGDTAVLAVADLGLGWTPAQGAALFEPFSQPHGSGRGGYGLGLHAAKLLVELHGGTIEAASPGPGQGSTFTIRLPLAGKASVPGAG